MFQSQFVAICSLEQPNEVIDYFPKVVICAASRALLVHRLQNFADLFMFTFRDTQPKFLCMALVSLIGVPLNLSKLARFFTEHRIQVAVVCFASLYFLGLFSSFR